MSEKTIKVAAHWYNAGASEGEKMSKRIFAIELDVDDMESNIYMRMSQSELLQLHDNINHLLLLDDAAESHNYRQTVKDEYSGEKVSLTIGLHKWAEVSR